MYFSSEQAEALAAVSRARRVSKSTVIRYAVERLLEQLKNGQVSPPFGV
jgi:Arc/MetJ-type ribon-helix-helix transcriptional regulator